MSTNYNQTIDFVANTTHSLKGNAVIPFVVNPLFKAFYGIKNNTLIKDPLETETLTFDFNSVLIADAIIKVAGVELFLLEGYDPNPMDRLETFSNSTTKTVGQRISGGLLGNRYQAVCTVDTDDSQVLVIRVNINIQES